MLRAVLVLVLLAAPLASAQAPPSRTMDLVVDVPAQGAPTLQGPEGILVLEDQAQGERVAWRLQSARAFVSIEIRVAAGAFDVERSEQIVPRLKLDAGERTCIDVRAKGACDDDLFAAYPNERVWEAQGGGRVYHRAEGDPLVLRLHVPGPANGTLALERDLTPPGLSWGEPTNVSSIGFLLETRTDELAIVDVQLRREGSDEWIPNPTTDFNLLQRFPVQGMAPDERAEYRILAHDWAMNFASAGPFPVRSAPRPAVAEVLVEPLEPAPNATLALGERVVVTLRLSSADPIDPSSIQLFFDKTAVAHDATFEGGLLTYVPDTALAAGKHSVSAEARTVAGGKGSARWTFDLVAPEGAPGLAPLALAPLALALALARRRHP